MWPFKRRKLKSYMLENQHRVIEAFKLNGTTYYMFDDSFKVPAGRGLMALTIYEEFEMRCTREYLKTHIRAVEVILEDPKKININALAIIHRNLKERLDLALFPDHIYKLASVIFFDDSESPYSYDFAYNKKKVENWKASGGTLDFFMQTPLKDLIPSLKLQGRSAQTYFQVAEEVDKLHQDDLREILSKHQ